MCIYIVCIRLFIVFNALNTIVVDMEGNIKIDRLPLAHGTAREISISIVRATTLWQSVYPDIVLFGGLK